MSVWIALLEEKPMRQRGTKMPIDDVEGTFHRKLPLFISTAPSNSRFPRCVVKRLGINGMLAITQGFSNPELDTRPRWGL